MGEDANRLCKILESKFQVMRDLVFDPLVQELSQMEEELSRRGREGLGPEASRKLVDNLAAVRQMKTWSRDGLEGFRLGLQRRGCLGGLGAPGRPTPPRRPEPPSGPGGRPGPSPRPEPGPRPSPDPRRKNKSK